MKLFGKANALVAGILLAFLAGCAGSATQESTGEYIDDAAITAKVKTALIRDDSLEARDISVETFKGVVQLSGFVDSEADIDEAEEVTESVSGVRDVKNDLRLRTEQYP